MTKQLKPNPAPPSMKDRPKCPACKKPLRPWIESKEERLDHGESYRYETVRRWWGGGYHGYGAFCTQRCAVRFANAVYRAGVTI